MSNNRVSKEPSKQVNDSNEAKLPPVKREVQINVGNTAVLTIQLLNSINENLIAIKELLKK